MTRHARGARRSARGTTRARSQDASATASAGTDPRVVLRTTVPGRSSACTVWGNHLRMNTLRFRPAHVRVADSRSPWCRRVLHHPPRPPPTRPARRGARVSSRHPTPTPSRLPNNSSTRPAPWPDAPRNTITRPLDKPFHVRRRAQNAHRTTSSGCAERHFGTGQRDDADAAADAPDCPLWRTYAAAQSAPGACIALRLTSSQRVAVSCGARVHPLTTTVCGSTPFEGK